MGDCYNKEALWPLRQNIMDCMSGYKGCYQRAYRCLGAAAEIMEDQRSALLTDSLSQKLAKRAHGILAREIPRHKDELPGQVKQRFLGAVSHKGVLCLYDTALAQCGRIYALSDSYGLAHELLIHLLAGAVANSPFQPSPTAVSGWIRQPTARSCGAAGLACASPKRSPLPWKMRRWIP